MIIAITKVIGEVKTAITPAKVIPLAEANAKAEVTAKAIPIKMPRTVTIATIVPAKTGF